MKSIFHKDQYFYYIQRVNEQPYLYHPLANTLL